MTIECALITGATGYIGGRLARRLADSGIHVVAIVRPGSDLRGAGIGCVEYKDDAAALARELLPLKPDALFHLAAHPDAGTASSERSAVLSTNVLFAATVLEAATISGCQILVNAGTQSQHRDGTAAYVPTSLYAASKQAFQDIVRYYELYEGLRAVTLKLSDVYGPADPRGRIIDLLLDAQRKDAIIDLSPGHQHIDFLHVDDACAAFAAAGGALAGNEALASEYCVASGQQVTLRELVRTIERLGNSPILARWGARRYAASAIMRPWKGPILPGWQPAIPLEDGLMDLIRTRRQSEAAAA